jgi:hypothetical protein
MDPDLAQLKAAAMTNAAKLIAQQQAPAYGPGSVPEIAATYQGAYQAPIARGQADAAVYNSGVTAENQQIDTRIAAQQAEARTDKSKYQMVKRKDGGYGFYDPTGKEISAYEYANIMGTTPDKVLSDSENPIDIGYRQDYADLNAYLQASLAKSTDKDAKALWDEMNRVVYVDTGMKLWTLKPQAVIEKFKQQYPTVYGMKRRGVPAGQLFMPVVNPSQSSNEIPGEY